MNRVRQIFAHIQSIGDVCFETESPMDGGPICARRVCSVSVSMDQKTGAVTGVNLTRMGAYQVGFMQDPVTINGGAVAFSCLAPKEMAVAAREAWSDIKIAGAIPRWNGRDR